MPPRRTPSSRKHSRQHSGESAEEEPSLALSSSKKRRLNSSKPASPAPTGALKAFASAISDAFGYGRRTVSSNGTVRNGNTPTDKTWEVPDFDEEAQESYKDKKTKRGTSHRTAPNAASDYDFLESEEAPSPATARSGRTRAKGLVKSVANGAVAEASSIPNGRRKTHRNINGAARAELTGDEALEKPALELGNPRPKDEPAAQDKSEPHSPAIRGTLTPQKRIGGTNRKSMPLEEGHGREAEIYFDDLPSKKTKPCKSATEAHQGPLKKANDLANQERLGNSDESKEDQDDEVCAICSKPDSKSPNLIIFCDGCDMAVHQKCYGVARVPKGSWFCKDCAKGPLSRQQNAGASGHKASISPPADESAPDIPNFERHLRSLQRILVDRCTGRRRIRIRAQDEAYERTFHLVEQTVLAGEGNSMLVIGARGCGKTTMVETVISDLEGNHRNEFHVVRLNGFIHTDDRLALKEIWRQLGKEMEVEDQLIGKTNNYADTLASLLALLSHPSEITGTEEGVTSRSVIFIIDEFDLFATHARQTLLYNLFDIAQARKAPIAVLGLTTRIDVVESLEKRVKSRFSHRYVYLPLPKSLPAYWDICRQGLVVDEADAKADGLDLSLEGYNQFQQYWEKKIEALSKDKGFKDQLEYHFFSTKSVAAFLAACILPLSTMSPTSPSLRIPLPSALGVSVGPPDSKLHLLESLSELDLSLLISAARLDIVAHTDTVNFAMAYDEYTLLIGKQRAQAATSGMLALGGGVRVWGRGVAETAWERLVSLGLLVAAGLGGRGGLSQGSIEAKMWKVDVALEEIPAAVKLNAVLARWCREI